MQITLLLAIAIATSATAHIFFKRGITAFGEVPFSLSNMGKMIVSAFTSPWIFSGMMSLGISFVLWLFIISKTNLSIAYPITISLQIVLITLSSWLFFHESFSFVKIAGIVIVICGLFLITKA